MTRIPGNRNKLAETAESPSRYAMKKINEKQKDYYNSQFEAQGGGPRRYANRSANVVTNLWTRARRKMLALGQEVGVEQHVLALHKEWLGDLRMASVLDFGCFDGNQLSLWMAENCKEYLGIDLSAKAVARSEEHTSELQSR